MIEDVEGDYGPQHEDGGELHHVGEVADHQLPQLLPAGDLARVQLLEHCGHIQFQTCLTTGGMFLKTFNILWMNCACNGDAEEDGDDEESDHVSAVALIRQLGQDALASEVESPGSLGQERNPPRQYLQIFNIIDIRYIL